MARKHLIIGCGSAALSALEKIRSITQEDEVKLVTREEYAPYSPTALPYLLSGRIGEAELWMRKEDYFREMRSSLQQGKEVIGVDPDRKEVTYQDGEKEGYDTLLIATGSEPLRPPIKGLEEAGFLGFRTMADYKRLVAALDGRKKEVVVLGGGLIGMELAAGLLEKGYGIQIVEKEPRLLPLYFDPEAEVHIREVFAQKGARIHTGKEVKEVRKGRERLEVGLSDGSSLAAELLITAVGVKAQASFLASSGIKVNRGIVVDGQMRTSAPDVYAAGDVAEAPGFFGGELGVNPILPSAVAQGHVAGAAMAGQEEPYEGRIPMNVFNFFGYMAFSMGLAMPTGNSYEIVAAREPERKTYKKLVFQDGRLVGAMFLNVAADPGVFLYLVRKRLDVGPHQGILLDKPREVSRWLMMANENREAASIED
jgi:phenylglyoxylate dehydrogenase epsilon subunit